ncbi:hypothetical protein BCR32DRAFT_243370 [Anaeromyces robustus]|uniref:Uncharacterized protein n=1 Tax=Anaeromyces robustus TaxID=1754192 RepID=A0A1Y1XCQ7_9FUNG|nr:hypothetical protein BCR32DRAFT_243370 [Anaeromyces robustus]|eukprot:ORX83505.1 hypothetical protein BCR32DRAFT_243370 [Anaeromyces robustus]
MDIISKKPLYIQNTTSSVNNTVEESNGLFIDINNNEGRIFLIANIFCILYFFVPLIGLIPYRKCYVTRALRLILLHRLNVFKVTELTKDKFVEKSKNGSVIEPNFYYKSLYKIVDKKIVRILIPIICIVEMIICILVHISCGNYCGFTQFVDINTKIIDYAKGDKENVIEDENNYGNMAIMFTIPQIIGIAFTLINFLIAIYFMFSDIRDDQKLGVKFDCFSNAFVNFIINIMYMVLKANEKKIMSPEKINVNPLLVYFYEVTKGGILLYVLIGFYVHTVSVVIPWIKCINTKRLNKKYVDEVN